MKLHSLWRCSVVLLAGALLAGCALGRPQLRADGGPMADCLDGPHCVSSQATDPDRHIEPLTY
ncbi:MAG: hypothetical protein ABF356_06560, partial [Polycyclovorans sp.]